MENLFRPGKWLVLFCGVFILLWAALQYVANSRLKQEAQVIGANEFTWTWPADNCQSKAEITEASVVQRTDRDAIVQVKGKQTLMFFPRGLDPAKAANPDRSETVDCSATLTFYRMSEKNKDYWVLGKVEFP